MSDLRAFDAKLAAQIFDRDTKALRRLPEDPRPAEGWISKVRTMLGMTVTQLAERMGTYQPEVSRLEKREREGGCITLAQMDAAAKALGCRFVYAIVPAPDTSATAMVEARAQWMSEKIYDKEIRIAREEKDRNFEANMRRSKDRYRTLREGQFLQTFGLLWNDKLIAHKGKDSATHPAQVRGLSAFDATEEKTKKKKGK